MFERAVEVSEAFREGAPEMRGTLHMAMKGCPECGTEQMIASPMLGICEECGSELVVLPNG
jgi:ribosomal protein S27E